jgi:D-glycero-D-manno-heptose 1,7-bisphosphate phosphatase
MKPVPKNLFCDRDGTIIYDRHYLADPAGVELLPGAAAGLLRISRLAGGLKLFVVTNQSGIGRGFFSRAAYEACQAKMAADLAEAGVTLTDCAFCPHAPADPGCRCRKPDTGMWEELRARHSLRPEESVMIGDKPDDIRFARRAGFAAAILVLSGQGEKSALALGLPVDPRAFPEGGYFDVGKSVPDKVLAEPGSMPDCLAMDLGGAADYLAARLGGGHA